MAQAVVAVMLGLWAAAVVLLILDMYWDRRAR